MIDWIYGIAKARENLLSLKEVIQGTESEKKEEILRKICLIICLLDAPKMNIRDIHFGPGPG